MINENKDGGKHTLESRESRLDVWMYVGMLGVLIGVIVESVPDFFSTYPILLTNTHRIGGAIVAVGLLIEFVVDIKVRNVRAVLKKIADEEFSTVLARATNAEKSAADANLSRVKIEAELLRTIGPRKLTSEQREHIGFMARELLPDTSFVVFVLTTLNAEEMMECVDFAWDISDALTNAGKDAPVLTLRDDSFGGLELHDIWIAVPPGSHDLGRAVFSFLTGERIKVVSSILSVPPPVLYRTERNGSGVSIPLTDAIKNAIGIVVAKRSQPIFRLEI
jgi:hypothetical protein